MSIEEIKKTLSTMIFAIDCPEPKISIGDMADVRESLSMALRSLEALELVKSDIEKYYADCMLSCADDECTCACCTRRTFESVLRIIEKHLKEVENG